MHISDPETQRLVVLVLATNFRESLDPAIVRRMDVKLFVPEPNGVARSELFEKVGNMSKEDSKQLSDLTQGYVASDIWLLCRCAHMEPFNRATDAKFFEVRDDGFYEPCAAQSDNSMEMGWEDVPEGKLYHPQITMVSLFYFKV